MIQPVHCIADVHFGDQKCYTKNDSFSGCSDLKTEDTCKANDNCEWDYAGSGLQYQILAGPAFIAIFTVSNIFTGLTSDRLGGRSRFLGRHTLMALGVVVFSASLFLMGLATSYWQLVVLRMGIAAGEAVCRPVSGSLIADLFTPSGRGLANGIFSWGVYYGYGLAYVIGIYLTSADVLGKTHERPNFRDKTVKFHSKVAKFWA